MRALAKYEVIKNDMLEKIEKGIYKENEKIPSENELCVKFDTSRITVRKAIDELVTTGKLYRVHGIGTFVSQEAKLIEKNTGKTILLILPNHELVFGSRMLHQMLTGIESTLYKEEYSLIFIKEPAKDVGAERERFINHIIGVNPAGILYCFYSDKNFLPDLEKLGVPVVFLDTEPDDNSFDVVTGEDVESAYQAACLMFSTGIKKIGFYSSRGRYHSVSRFRCQGVEKAFLNMGLPYESRWFCLKDTFTADESIENQKRRVDNIIQYLNDNQELEALIVMGDDDALDLCNATNELGLQIPEDLKVISYGNYNWSNYVAGGISSFEQHFNKYGREAAKLVVKRVEGTLPNIQQRKIISYNLIRRNSF